MLDLEKPLNLKKLTSADKGELILGLWEQNRYFRAEQQQLRKDLQALRAANVLLFQALEKAHERIKELEGQLFKNNSNSSKPPSSDGMNKPKPKSQRGKNPQVLSKVIVEQRFVKL